MKTNEIVMGDSLVLNNLICHRSSFYQLTWLKAMAEHLFRFPWYWVNVWTIRGMHRWWPGLLRLVTVSHWTGWCSNVGWGSLLAVHDQPLVSELSVLVAFLCICVKREQLQCLFAGIMGLTPISVQLTPSNTQFLEGTHTHTQENMQDATEVLNSGLFRAAFCLEG